MGRKAVTPGHVVENGATLANESGTALDTMQETEAFYAPDMAPLTNVDTTETRQEAPQTTQVEPGVPSPDTNTLETTDVTEEPTTDPDSNTLAHADTVDDIPEALPLVVLKNGGTFCFQGQLFRKGEPTATEPETAERLVRSGFFERG